MRAYDEVAASVANLTAECNEFQRYCLKRSGAKAAAPSQVADANNSGNLEANVDAAFVACHARLTKAEDRATLVARRSYVLGLIGTLLLLRIAELCASYCQQLPYAARTNSGGGIPEIAPPSELPQMIPLIIVILRVLRAIL